MGPWRSLDAVEYATLEWVEFNHRRLLEPRSLDAVEYATLEWVDTGPVCGSGAVVCSLSLLIRWAQRARCQAETPLSVLFRFLRPALLDPFAIGPCTVFVR